MRQIFERHRWFFLQISGRRRIGKTTLIQRAIQAAGIHKTLYIQIPDSDAAGVAAVCNGYLETFGLEERVHNLAELAGLVSRLVEAGYIIALDEFQYFHRKQLFDFCSLLQAEVDQLAARSDTVRGGLIVLGSLHAEMTALLDDRDAPLFNRVTDTLELGHLDTASILDILRTHADDEPYRLLFFWNLFEGVPKFYRDAFEQGVLGDNRDAVLERLFFASSSPLKTEADNWFLRELRGRYDMILHFLATHPGCTNADIEATMQQYATAGDARQVGGYLKVLAERYRMIERRLPILAKAKARSGRYYIRDNFLRAWLSALQKPVSAAAFRPLDTLIEQADTRLKDVEGFALEDLIGQLYHERSRLGLGSFMLSERVQGYWDRADVEIDLVAISEDDRKIRFGTCKRNPAKLPASIQPLLRSAERFLNTHRRFADWTIEYVGLAPVIDDRCRAQLAAHGLLAEDLGDLTREL
ncbi:MAG: AAA family ATPase [Wenzhouxiangella sp.]|nr:AAA family ATPase [Wenzhouxiangella sp.]